MLRHVFIVSDGTGRTAQQALRAALVQFESTKVKTYVRPGVRTAQQVMKVIGEAYKTRAIILHTIVSKNLRDLFLEQSRLHELNTIDLMGPLLAQLSHHFRDEPTEKPGIYHKLNKAYFQRIEAIEFMLRHDDGQRHEELNKADIILLGVSRTFKTPLSVYMAYKGWHVANIPIIYGFQLPKILYSLPHERIFCLTTNYIRLAELRKTRDEHLGGLTGEYSSKAYVKKELDYANKLYNLQPKWTKIRITDKPIEEISSEILSNLRKRNRRY
jgi:regulator of PEP synthase PpsR (kinase-PPPase family)